jgi:hypothetical protein
VKNILYQSIVCQTHFGMPRRAKLSLVLNEPKLVFLHSNSNTYMHHKQREIIDTYAKQPMENYRETQLPKS